ncbi:MAG: hypothetical protein R2762_12660 [Bryobacteraceae bacterium]
MAGKSTAFASLALVCCLPLAAATLEDALTDLARRIRTAVRGEVISLEVRPAADPDRDRVAAQLARALGRLQAPGDGITAVTVTLSKNLESRLIVAEVGPDGRAVFIHPFGGGLRDAGAAEGPVLLEPRLLYRSPGPIFAAVEAAGGVVLLRPGIIEYRRGDESGPEPPRTEFVPVRPLPRDPRGVVTIESGWVRAWLDSVRCSGTLDPWTVRCAQGDSLWNLAPGVEARLVEGRNFFLHPAGQIFNVVRMAGRPGAGMELVAAHTDGSIRRHGEGGEEAVLARDAGTEIGLVRTCPGSEELLLSSDGGALQAYRVGSRALIPVGRPARVAGMVVAVQGGLAIVRDPSAGYSVYRIEARCDR